jgi:subtilisin family serine protease
MVAQSSTVFRAGIKHKDPGAVAHPAGGTVHRHSVQFYVRPKESGGNIDYYEGIYEVKIKAPPGTVLFAKCSRTFWARGKAVIFEHATQMQDPAAAVPSPPEREVTATASTTDPLGRHVITVASYNDTNHHIASSSSRGPLRDYSDPVAPKGVIAAKPNIAAPGVGIMAAASRHINPLAPPLVRPHAWLNGVRFIPKGGTSMATPMIAGVVALMLDKKPNLNINEARSLLNSSVRAAVNPAAPPDSTNAYGSGMVDALPTHDNTTP